MHEILKAAGISSQVILGAKGAGVGSSGKIEVRSPVNNEHLADIGCVSRKEYDRLVEGAVGTFHKWRLVPAPQRGEVVRKIGNALRERKHELGALVTLEMGKIRAEGEGEIQEAIDIADFAVGLSRQLYGKMMHSERVAHRMYEQWHPLGPVGVISAFNFPAAVWAWNAMIAAVCGDVVIWKPSELAPLTAIAVHSICEKVASDAGYPGLFSLVCGGREVGEWIASDTRVPLVSATGSTRMGREVGKVVAARFGRSLLELGGNNAVIVLRDANLDLAVRAITFGAVGTAGQRCTSIRRILVERDIQEELSRRLVKAYGQVKIGNPLDTGVLMGPLINARAREEFERACRESVTQGGVILCGGKLCEGMPSNLYVHPTIIRSKASMPILQEEIFVPVAHLVEVGSLDEAVEINNAVSQGLSSAIFTESVRAAEQFLSHRGSDCGIANVNIGTSGAEIGGAFGGEKETGGGREAGSDSWKQYMRRQTVTINYSKDLPLAQGIKFEVE